MDITDENWVPPGITYDFEDKTPASEMRPGSRFLAVDGVLRVLDAREDPADPEILWVDFDYSTQRQRNYRTLKSKGWNMIPLDYIIEEEPYGH